MSVHVYSAADDTASGTVHAAGLLQEIVDDGGLPSTPDLIVVSDAITITFVETLTAPEITALDAVVAAHTGVAAPKAAIDLFGSWLVVPGEVAASGGSWNEVGGVVVDAEHLSSGVANVKLRICGEVKTNSAAGRLRLIGGASTEMIDPNAVIPDTTSAWVAFVVDTDVTLLTGLATYGLGVKRNGATLSVRRMSILLVDIETM